MRAAVYYEHGGRDVLQVVDDLPDPGAPSPGMVRVNIKAVALNRLDLWVREGWKGLKLPMPHIVCADGAGVVDAVGEGVTNVSPGDRVGINPSLVDPDCLNLTGDELANSFADCLDIQILGEHVQGVAAEYVHLPARNLIKLPDHVSFAKSAAAGLVYVTSWHSMITRGGLKAGESVLILGAGGGVSTASIQVAKLAGCTVYVVGGSAEKCARARELGANVVIDRSADASWSKILYSATNKRGVDVVIDNVGQATLPDSLRAVKRGGRILIVGNTSGYQANIDTRYIFSKQISLIGSSMGPTADFITVMEQIFTGKLKPVIGATLPIADIREGHRLLEAGEVFGKIVLEF